MTMEMDVYFRGIRQSRLRRWGGGYQSQQFFVNNVIGVISDNNGSSGSQKLLGQSGKIGAASMLTSELKSRKMMTSKTTLKTATPDMTTTTNINNMYMYPPLSCISSSYFNVNVVNVCDDRRFTFYRLPFPHCHNHLHRLWHHVGDGDRGAIVFVSQPSYTLVDVNSYPPTIYTSLPSVVVTVVEVVVNIIIIN